MLIQTCKEMVSNWSWKRWNSIKHFYEILTHKKNRTNTMGCTQWLSFLILICLSVQQIVGLMGVLLLMKQHSNYHWWTWSGPEIAKCEASSGIRQLLIIHFSTDICFDFVTPFAQLWLNVSCLRSQTNWRIFTLDLRCRSVSLTYNRLNDASLEADAF